MLLELSEHDKSSLKAAIDLEALYTMQGVWGFQDLRTENSIGTAMVCGGLYELEWNIWKGKKRQGKAPETKAERRGYDGQYHHYLQ